jgi:hypothetical protein
VGPAAARRRLAAAAAVAGAAIVAAAAQASAPAPVLRLPDLTVERPAKLSVAWRSGHWHLGFDSASFNAGDGPLVVVGTRSGDRRMTAVQLVARTLGGTLERPRAGRMRYVVSPDHRHWHLDDYMRYELRRARDGRLVRPDQKTGFCLGDRYAGRGVDRVGSYLGMCGLGRSTLRRVRQGLSAGFGDAYGAYLEGQSIDLSGVPAGEYLLVHRVNPARRLLERRYDNNTACVRFTLRWPEDRDDPPALLDRSKRCRYAPASSRASTSDSTS